MKKLLSLFLSFGMLVGLLSMTACTAPEDGADDEKVAYTDQDMLNAFVEYMNEKASDIGMTNTLFRDPVGMGNTTTVTDVMRLLVYADANYPALQPIWNTEQYSVTVSGVNSRVHTASTIYYSNPYLEPYYHITGIKGGSYSTIFNVAAIVEIPNSDDRLAVVAFYADGSRETPNNAYAATKQAADAAMIKYNDPTADNSTASVCCKSAIVCLIPAEGADMNNLQILYSKDADTVRAPASVSKIMTAICVLDLQKDISQMLTYKEADTKIGKFYAMDFVPGEMVSYEGALYALMLDSSNVSARALARSAGEVLLKKN